MKQFITTVLLAACVLNASAQSRDEGIKMYKYERYQTAKEILEPLAASDPVANYYLGLSVLATGNVDEAAGIFAKYPDNYPNMSGMARVSFAKGNPTEGMKLAENLADKGRKKEWEQKKYAADAINYSKGGDINKAVELYEDVLSKNETADILINAGDAYQQLSGGGGKAMSSYEKVVAMDPNNSLAYSRMGKLWYDAKTYDSAVSNWKRAQEADPSNPLPYYDLANAYTYVHKYALAKENIEKYMEHSDKTTEDQLKYVDILYLAKDCDKTIAKIGELRNKGIDEAKFYGMLAYCYMEQKDSVSAVKALENVRKYFGVQDKKKLYPQEYMYYGRILLNNDMGDSANYYFNKSLQMDTATDKSARYRDIAESFRQNRDWKNSAVWYQKIISDYTDKATATDYFWGGYTYFLSSELKMADSTFGLMTEKFADEPSGYYWRGRVNTAIDSLAENGDALPYYEKWLTIEKEGYERKDKDVMFAYQYMALYYYKKEDKEKLAEYLEKIAAIDPENSLYKQLKEWLDNSNKKQ